MRLEVPSDCIVYLQESDYNVGAENDLETFSQSMSCKESDTWYNAMKGEMNSTKSNNVWNLTELPNKVRAICCKWVYKTKKDSLGNIKKDSKARCRGIYLERTNRLHGDLFYCVKERFSSCNFGIGTF